MKNILLRSVVSYCKIRSEGTKVKISDHDVLQYNVTDICTYSNLNNIIRLPLFYYDSYYIQNDFI